MSEILAPLLAWKGVLAGGWLLFMLAAERLQPATSRPPAPPAAYRRLGSNLALWAINLALSPLVVLPLTALAASHAVSWRPV